MPDCATLMIAKGGNGDMERSRDTSKPSSQQKNDAKSLVVKELHRLEEFVNSKVSCIRDKDDELKSIQYFLPSIARTSYKVRSKCRNKLYTDAINFQSQQNTNQRYSHSHNITIELFKPSMGIGSRAYLTSPLLGRRSV